MKIFGLDLSDLKLPTTALPPRIRRIVALSGYPIFYLFCLLLFAYFTFPYERLKERLLVELEAQRQNNPGAQRIEIQSLGPYWFSGVTLKGLTLVSPRTGPAEAEASSSKLTFDQAHVRVSLLPLLIGRVTVNFGAKAFDGSIDGSTRSGSEGRAIEASLEDINVAKLSMLGDLVGGLPMAGTLNGKMAWMLPDQKLSKATGTLSISISDFTAADGKTKIGGKLALPQLDIGTFELSAEAKDGILKISKLGAQGKDLDLAGEGKISLRDVFTDSLADLYLRFRFSDTYKTKNEMTKSLFGAPGSNMPALFELADFRIKNAKRADGFYGWHMVGQLKDPRFESSPAGGPGGAASPVHRASPTPAPPTTSDRQ